MPPPQHQSSPPDYSTTTTSISSTTSATSTISTSSTSPPASQLAAVPPLPPLYPTRHDLDRQLPPLSSLTLTGGQALPIRSDMSSTVAQPPSLPPPPAPWAGFSSVGGAQADLSSMQAPLLQPRIDSPITMDRDSSRSSVASAASSDGRTEGRAQSVTLDDPDVRLAAEALGDLRADFVSSPPNHNASLPVSPPALQLAQTTKPSQSSSSSSVAAAAEPEPLFSLLTTSHPLLATTIEGASSAYGGAKNFSPRFKSSAEYVEGYLTPLANTVGSVGRVTGVEGGVRWFLGAGRRQRSDQETVGGSKKRRKVESPTAEPMTKKRLEAQDSAASTQTASSDASANMDGTESYPSTPKGDRRLSLASTVETLPAYDDMRSPAYSETMDPQSSSARRASAPWQSRLIMSTSGLSVAMSDESLRSLKYCLTWLRWTNDHIGGVIGNLKTTLEQYEKPDEETDEAQLMLAESGETRAVAAAGDPQGPRPQEPSRDELISRIDLLKGDVLKSLQDAINMVSRYAGGALPENARILVRRHLTSLPQRFRLATMSENRAQPISRDGDTAVRDSAQKVLVLAKEGLDMVSQVSGIVDGTIVSAEEWCERIGKKRRDSRSAEGEPVLPQVEPRRETRPPPEADADVAMG